MRCVRMDNIIIVFLYEFSEFPYGNRIYFPMYIGEVNKLIPAVFALFAMGEVLWQNR